MAKKNTARVLDPVEDFDTPVRREPSLEATPEPAAPTVSGSKVLMQFVRLRPTKELDGERLLKLEMSVGLTDEIVAQMPDKIAKGFRIMEKNHSVAALSIDDVDAQTVAIYEASDMGGAAISAVGITPERVRIAVVEETGAGAERKVTRLSLVLPIPQSREYGEWALRMHGELVWVELHETQGKFPS